MLMDNDNDNDNDNGIHPSVFLTCKADGQSAITSAASLSDLIFLDIELILLGQKAKKCSS